MIATFESINEVFAEATRQATRNASFAGDTARRYVDEVATANRDQFAAMDSFQQAIYRSVYELQSASFQISRSVLDAANVLNRALLRWAASAIWPWEPLGPLTEPVDAASSSTMFVPEADYDASQVGDCVMSALRFQGPMGMISSGMGELED